MCNTYLRTKIFNKYYTYIYTQFRTKLFARCLEAVFFFHSDFVFDTSFARAIFAMAVDTLVSRGPAENFIGEIRTLVGVCFEFEPYLRIFLYIFAVIVVALHAWNIRSR